MAKTLKPAPHFSLPEVEKQYKNEKEATIKTHWQIIYLRLKGKKVEEIAETVSYTPGWVREIIRRYNKEGKRGLEDKRIHNGGNRYLLDEKQRARLLHTLKEEKPKDGGLWTGPKVTAWIEEEIGKKIRPATGWDYLTRLGFSIHVPRPFHARADLKAQEEFKKNCLKL
jgi:transposase